MAADDEQDFEGQSTGSMGARDRDAPNISAGPSSPGIIEGSPNVTADPEDVLGSEAGLAAAQAAASAAASSSQMGNDPTFSGSNAIIEVDTFEDIQAAQMARDVRTMSNAWDAHKTGGYAGYAVYKENDPNTATTSGSYSPAGAKRGSVNLSPIGNNVGYQVGYQIDTFEQLDESTKAAVEAAKIQSQSEDETENAIAQMWGAFQSILSKAGKNTENRQQDSGAEAGSGN